VTTIDGFTGKCVWLGQALIGSRSPYTHAFVVVGEDLLIQAEPGGAKFYTFEEQLTGRKVAFSSLPLTDEQRNEVAWQAIQMHGTPYSFLDYLAIGLTRAHFPSKRLRKYVADSGHMICSQFADEAHRRAGVELFADAREPGSVVPGDLAHLIGEK
jgi:uncharacterized protein YycO